jgi:long-chain acyl-CoA synthetase
VRNNAAMLGYYKEPGMTRDMFTEDGFIKTGDEGYIDKEGYLIITGRTKDIFKTSKGKYVVPSPIETKLTANANIEFCCVTGADLPQPIALITLSESGKHHSKETLLPILQQELDTINQSIDAHERIEKLVVITDTWTPDNGMLTPTFKLIRRSIEKKYQAHFVSWYQNPNKIIWDL